MKISRIVAILMFAANTFCLQAQTITIHKADGTKLEYHCGEVDSIINYQIIPETEEHEAVDLGLSVLWATCNIGASSPYQEGYRYAWGETIPKEEGTRENYWYYIEESDSYKDLGNDISGTMYDVARQEWGGDWRIPNEKEIKELVEQCTWKYITAYDAYLITGPNGNTIFMPLFAAPNAPEYFFTKYWSSTTRGYEVSFTFSHCISLYAYYDWGLLDDNHYKISLEFINECACIRPVKNK